MPPHPVPEVSSSFEAFDEALERDPLQAFGDSLSDLAKEPSDDPFQSPLHLSEPCSPPSPVGAPPLPTPQSLQLNARLRPSTVVVLRNTSEETPTTRGCTSERYYAIRNDPVQGWLLRLERRPSTFLDPAFQLVVVKQKGKLGFRSALANGQLLQCNRQFELKFASHKLEAWEEWSLRGRTLADCSLRNTRFKLTLHVSVTIVAVPDMFGNTQLTSAALWSARTLQLPSPDEEDCQQQVPELSLPECTALHESLPEAPQSDELESIEGPTLHQSMDSPSRSQKKSFDQKQWHSDPASSSSSSVCGPSASLHAPKCRAVTVYVNENLASTVTALFQAESAHKTNRYDHLALSEDDESKSEERKEVVCTESQGQAETVRLLENKLHETGQELCRREEEHQALLSKNKELAVKNAALEAAASRADKVAVRQLAELTKQLREAVTEVETVRSELKDQAESSNHLKARRRLTYQGSADSAGVADSWQHSGTVKTIQLLEAHAYPQPQVKEKQAKGRPALWAVPLLVGLPWFAGVLAGAWLARRGWSKKRPLAQAI